MTATAVFSHCVLVIHFKQFSFLQQFVFTTSAFIIISDLQYDHPECLVPVVCVVEKKLESTGFSFMQVLMTELRVWFENA